MILSRYNITLKDYPVLGYTTLYNLLSKKYICLKDKYLIDFENSRYIARLKEDDFIVDNEQSEIDVAVNKYYQNISDKKLTLVLMLTTNCNCICTYCYQGKNKIVNNLDDININKILSFIDNYIKEYSIDDIEIVFYGGEPLLNKKAINKVSEYLFKKYDSKFSFSIITNGTLLSLDDVLIWNCYNLKSIKITIDGPKEIHDIRRIFVSGKGTYDVIIKNILKIQNHTNIIVNFVLDQMSFVHIQELLNQFQKLKFKVSISINLIRPVNILSVDVQAKYILETSRMIKKFGFFQFSKIGTFDGEICPYKKEHHFAIDCQGNVYRCNAFLGTGKSIATIKNFFKKDVFQIQDKCVFCKYLPICYSGCQYEKNCDEKLFDLIIPDLVKIYTTNKY